MRRAGVQGFRWPVGRRPGAPVARPPPAATTRLANDVSLAAVELLDQF